MFEIGGFVALSDNEDDNKENRRQPLEDVETVNRCTHNALSTHKPTNFICNQTLYFRDMECLCNFQG